ncbi:MAG: 30S ribosomal protein S12 methylthiotransferase RimO [Clostridiales Family XIII bacterium]|nr:30S ribosomal protein S12 methylthiotransferase RimO [Clostridiales Family XIII bacterium]
MSRVYISTVGCLKNEEDSERVAGLLSAGGHEIVFSPEEAEVLVVNTCAFIEDAQRESIDELLSLAEYREDGKKLIAMGCLTQLYADELAESLPEVDAILGVNEHAAIADVVNGIEGRSVLTDGVPGIAMTERYALTPRHSATLKIAEGCSNSCTYCIIPKIRGPYRSAPKEALVAEAEKLASEGCKELVVIAQDTSLYGIDIYGRLCLPELLRELCAVEGIEWIRLLYCYDERVTDELIEAMASEPKILHYIDMPIQHISGAVLGRMGRASSPGGIRDTLARLHTAMPDITVRSSLITGFPGETEEEFEELCEFVGEGLIARVGIFTFSPVAGTPAAAMDDQVQAGTSEARRAELMEIARGNSLAANEAFVGSIMDVIVDEPEAEAENGIWLGRTKKDAPEVDGAVIFSVPAGSAERDLSGHIIKVRIDDAMDYDLVGVMIEQ